MSSQLTQDSGIHTMSSRRDSALSDGALPHVLTSLNSHTRRTSSDCSPATSYPNEIVRNVEHVTDRLQNVNIVSSLVNSCCCSTSTCMRREIGTCMGHRSGCDVEVMRNCHSKDCSHCHCMPPSCRPADPGGGSNNDFLKCFPSSNSQIQAQSHHSRFTNEPIFRESDKPSEQISNPESRSCKFTYSKSDKDDLYEKLKKPGLTKLCSQRLLPTRHQTKNALLSILNDGEVCIEFFKKRGSMKKDTVCEVLRISPDGMRIVLYEPDNGKGTPVSDIPPPLPAQGADQIYSIENLPEKHWKKYQYAYKFVSLVRAKTPKITYYSDKAKCLLMESLTDFEACFYEGGKVTQSTTEGIAFIDQKGNKHTIKDESELKNLEGVFQLMWRHFEDFHSHCLLLERTLSKLPGTNFPIIIGRRPITDSCSKESHTGTFMSTFTVSVDSSTGRQHHNASTTKKVVVPGIGSAERLPNGEVQVSYTDGSQLWVDGKHHIKFQYPDGQIVQYSDDDNIPQIIMDKLQHMPKVLKYLMPSFPNRIHLPR